MPRHGAVLIALAVLTATGFWVLPGHTWLQSDTQIYIPIFERLYDSTLFRNEIIAQQPHVSFTIYDEAARLWRGTNFQEILTLQQVLFRFCGLLGVYLMASAMGLSPAGCLLAAACYGLGATINGPAVLTIEYEPVPRAFALGLTLLAMGLVAHGRYSAAGAAAALALLYHPPAVYPYWAGFGAVLLFTRDKARWKGLALMVAGIALLLVAASLQTGEGERQEFFQRLDPMQAEAMRVRASYNWISLWTAHQPEQYLLFWALGLGALWRLRSRIPRQLALLAATVSTAGVLSMPVSYLMLETLQISLAPQLQPMRALLYVTLVMVIFGACAAAVAAESKRWWEAAAWLIPVLSVSTHTRTFWQLFEPMFWRPAVATLVAVGLCVFVLRTSQRWALVALPFVVLWISGVRNYPPLHHEELDALSRWALGNTPKDAMFLFPEADRGLIPGVFRVKASRALYVDWKGGGQINFLREFLPLWKPRWEQTMARRFAGPADLPRFRDLGIDYVVTVRPLAEGGPAPVYQNAKYWVYPLRQALRKQLPSTPRLTPGTISLQFVRFLNRNGRAVSCSKQRKQRLIQK